MDSSQRFLEQVPQVKFLTCKTLKPDCCSAKTYCDMILNYINKCTLKNVKINKLH